MTAVAAAPSPPRPRYVCGVCGLGVIVLANAGNTSIVRACACKGVIVANAEAAAVGRGGMKG